MNCQPVRGVLRCSRKRGFNSFPCPPVLQLHHGKDPRRARRKGRASSCVQDAFDVMTAAAKQHQKGGQRRPEDGLKQAHWRPLHERADPLDSGLLPATLFQQLRHEEYQPTAGVELPQRRGAPEEDEDEAAPWAWKGLCDHGHGWGHSQATESPVQKSKRCHCSIARRQGHEDTAERPEPSQVQVSTPLAFFKPFAKPQDFLPAPLFPSLFSEAVGVPRKERTMGSRRPLTSARNPAT